MRLGCNAIAVVWALANQPEDIAVGIGNDQLTAFFTERHLSIGQEVADELVTLHAKGTEYVARSNRTNGQRKANVCCIERNAIICL